jgi:polyferredoxin
VRKTIQTICVIIFILLPLFDIMRVDLVRQRFYFFGAELWISEFSILFLTMMFLWILVAAMAMIYGRFYCGYLCPQMIFSEAANTIEKRITRMVNRNLSNLGAGARAFSPTRFSTSSFCPPPSSFRSSSSPFSFPLSISSIACSHSTSAPPAASSAPALPWSRSSTSPSSASASAPRSAPTATCRTCSPIAIRCRSFFQLTPATASTAKNACAPAPWASTSAKAPTSLECTHCAECIDACSAVLGRLGRKSLIHYAWGDPSQSVVEDNKWYRRIGLRDGKRIAVLVLLFIYASGLSLAIHLRQPVLVRIMPDRITLYTRDADGLIHNRYRLLASNRGHADSKVTLSLADLPAAHVVGLQNGITLKPGETQQFEFDVAAAASDLPKGVSHLRILAHVVPGQSDEAFPETFITPMESAAPASTPSPKEH